MKCPPLQDDELRMLGVENMEKCVESRKMTWFHCPVPDFSAPGMFFEGATEERNGGGIAAKMF